MSISCVFAALLLLHLNTLFTLTDAGTLKAHLFASNSNSSSSTLYPIVNTPLGGVQGVQINGGTVTAYYGVPYAASPVGNLRFAAPQPVSAWNTTLNATIETPLCMSNGGSGTEDCLRIDIYVPANATSDSKLPVAAVIPGGGYTGLTNFTGIASTVQLAPNMIILYIRYRVNIFGFLALQGLSAESSPYQSSGNYGLMDQILGLQWVQNNIASFGGDPTRVTVEGGSAGGWSMCFHLISPMSKGLFSQMIAQSGSCDVINVVTRSLDEAENNGQTWLNTPNTTNCSLAQVGYNYTAQVECIRTAPAIELLNAWAIGGGTEWYWHNAAGQVVDGWILPDWPATLYRDGKVNSVPLLLGSDTDEGTQFTAADRALTIAGGATEGSVGAWVANFSNVPGTPVVPAVNLLTYYTNTSQNFTTKVPPYNYTTPVAQQATATSNGNNTGPEAAIADIIGAAFFQCGMRREARSITASGSPVYLFQIGYYPASSIAYAGHDLGHAYWLREASVLVGVNATSQVQFYNLVNGIDQYWISFIVNGNPNNSTGLQFQYGVNSSLPEWTVYNTTQDNFIQIGTDNYVNNADAPKCDLWDTIQQYPYYVPRCAAGATLTNNGSYYTCSNSTTSTT